MIKERPLLFQGPMVMATLDGRKTQTRRIANRLLHFGKITDLHLFGKRNDAVSFKYGDGVKYTGPIQDLFEMCPYGQAGDRLWVREAHALVPASAYRMSDSVQQMVNPADPDQAAIYRAGWDRSGKQVWRPSIHMPRWASRIDLEITRVRIERLQDISEADVMSEGLKLLSKDGGRTYKYGIPDKDGLPGTDDHGWPWVWVVEFARV